MAGIEKICELSGEYPAHLMYGYKENHIQIMPKLRKKFRGANHILYVFKPRRFVKAKNKSTRFYTYTSLENLRKEMSHYEPPFKDSSEYFDYTEFFCNYKSRWIEEHTYMLKVMSPELQGSVGGEYVNESFRIKTAKRKLKRMLRCQTLNVEYIPMTYQEWVAQRNL